jgi:AGZA family xanthine/uracil permease-like MFS transporter
VGFASALVPVEAGAAILLWIGITIAAQAFQATPREHAPAVVVGFFPALAAWGLIMLENGLRAANSSIGALGLAPLAAQFPVAGMIALERGFIFTSMVLAAVTVALVEGRYRGAAAWALVAAAVSATGLMHGYEISAAGVVNSYGPSTTWPFVIGYCIIAFLFIVFGWNGKQKQTVSH